MLPLFILFQINGFQTTEILGKKYTKELRSLPISFTHLLILKGFEPNLWWWDKLAKEIAYLKLAWDFEEKYFMKKISVVHPSKKGSWAACLKCWQLLHSKLPAFSLCEALSFPVHPYKHGQINMRGKWYLTCPNTHFTKQKKMHILCMAGLDEKVARRNCRSCAFPDLVCLIVPTFVLFVCCKKCDTF